MWTAETDCCNCLPVVRRDGPDEPPVVTYNKPDEAATWAASGDRRGAGVERA